MVSWEGSRQRLVVLLSLGACAVACAPADRASAPRAVGLTLVPTADGVDTPVLGASPGPSLPAAAWDGQRFFLSWDDVRTTAGRIAATRIEADGAVVDSVNLLAPQPSGVSEWQSAVACTDTECLVAFKAIPYSTVIIQAARFDRNGNVLDATPIAVSPTGSSYDAQPPSVVFDGAGFVVAWAQQTSSSGSAVYGVRVTAAGVVTDKPPKSLVTSTTSTSLGGAHLVHDGTDVVLTWTEGTSRVLVSRVATDLTLRDAPPIAVGGTPAGAVGAPALAGDGTGFLVAWTENDTAAGGPAIKAQRFAADTTATSSVVVVEPATAGAVYAIAAAFDGTGYWLSWARTTTDSDVFLARLDAAAAPAGGVHPYATGAGDQYGPALASGSGRTLIAWMDVGGIYERVLPNAGLAVRASLSLNKETKPAVVWNGTGFTALWLDTRDAPQQVYGMALDQDAAPLHATAFPISQGTDYVLYAALGSDGTNALAAWTVGTTNPVPTRARRFDATGAPVGGEISVATGSFTPRSIAFGGGVYLIAGDTSVTTTQSLAIRVDAAGHVLDSAPFLLATGQSNPTVASDGTNFLVVFRPSTTSVPAVRVGANGQLLDAAPLDLFPPGAEPLSTASVAFGGGVYLIVWEDIAIDEIGGVRVNPDGTHVDQTVLKVTSQTALDVESNPAVTFNGTTFVVSWRNSLYDSNDQVKAEAHKYTTVTPAGVVGSIGILATLASGDDLLQPIALAGGAGRTLAAYQTLDTTPPYAIDRVKLRYLAPDVVPIGGRCAINVGCVTGGVCVDSTCCGSSCAGGGNDCQACSLTAGAAQNGTCGMLAQGTGCATAGMCSAAGMCVSPPDAGSDARDGATESGVLDGAVDRPADAKPADASGGDAVVGGDASGDRGLAMDAPMPADGAGLDSGGGGSGGSGGGADAAAGTNGGAGGAGVRDAGATSDAPGGTGPDAGKSGSPSGGCGCATAPPGSGELELAGCALALFAAVARRRRRQTTCSARRAPGALTIRHVFGK